MKDGGEVSFGNRVRKPLYDGGGGGSSHGLVTSDKVVRMADLGEDSMRIGMHWDFLIVRRRVGGRRGEDDGPKILANSNLASNSKTAHTPKKTQTTEENLKSSYCPVVKISMAPGHGNRQLRAMLRKNWLLKKRHPFITSAELLMPTVVMLLLIAVRTGFDTTVHPVQAYIREGMFLEIGNSQISPSFDTILQLMVAQGEYLAFAPDTIETRLMLQIMSAKFPLLKMAERVYKDEQEFETYIRSDLYGIVDHSRNLSNPKIKGAIIFHEQGPQLYDYSIRLNHTWAFSGFPDVNSIMDVNGPYLDDLALGVNIVPTLQYGISGFLSLQQVVDSFIIFISQQNLSNFYTEKYEKLPINASGIMPHFNIPWTQFTPANIRIAPFPTRAYTDDEFQSVIKKVMGVLYLLGFLYPISRLISYSVFEKEEKIKEGFYMMGLKDKMFYLSWFITYTLQFAISSAIITASTMNSLFLYSDKSLVFTYFFVFSLSAIMLCFLISTFFSRAKTAVAVGTLSFLGLFFPYYTVNDPTVSLLLKVCASLLSPTAFALGTINFADYERAHVGVRWTNMWKASSGINFLFCLLMMALDAVLYFAIGLYLDKVLPSDNGLRYPWNFLFTKEFWGGKDMLNHHLKRFEHKFEKLKYKGQQSNNGFIPSMEAVTLDMKQQELDGRCIQVRDLHKVYMTRKGKCCAVNTLNLTLYENQVLALLGHNGAGKSTTISMLIGLLQPTSGDALVFGKSIRTHMDEIRKGLGVCPQYDILFPELTVKEHLQIFAIIKGINEDMLETKVTEMINEVGLGDKMNTSVGSLSGGTKRKLSLGIALIGDSKVIILDEPTSGMDPYSMRSTWQLIKKLKRGRIILLTTHSMDEADVLGDRIAIMANGSLNCCGSSLFLKHRFGVGYTLTMSTSNSSLASDVVHRHVPSAMCLSDIGNEISFRLPLATSSFQHMFQEIESCIQKSQIQSHLDYDERKGFHGIESYGVSVTTLEEVFLKVSGQSFDENGNMLYRRSDAEPASFDDEVSYHDTTSKLPDSKYCLSDYWKTFGALCSAMGRAFFSTLKRVCSFIVCFLVKLCSCGLFTKFTFCHHCKALFIKRSLCARRDKMTVIFQLFIPVLFLFIGLLFLKLEPHPDQSSLKLTTSYFNPLLRGGGGGGPIPFNLSSMIARKVSSHIKGGWIQKEEAVAFRFPDAKKTLVDALDVAGPRLGPALISMSEFLISSIEDSYQSRYGAIVIDEQEDDGSLGYTVLHNCTCQHGAPIYINLMNSAILRLATGKENMTINIRNHPLPMTLSQRLQRNDLDAFSVAIIVTIAFSFIPASFAVSIVKEREVGAKHQQMISGVSLNSYWISTLLWDFISFIFPSLFAIILFFIFDLKQFIGYSCFLPTLIIFLEFGLAVASSTYCISFFFSDHSIAQNVVLLVHFFSGLILMVISFIMGLMDKMKNVNSFLKNIFRLSPGFCFADGLASLALRRQDLKMGSGTGTFDWNITGASICYLGIESIAFFLMTIGIENFPSHKWNIYTMKEWWSRTKIYCNDTSQGTLEPLLGSYNDSSVSITNEDVDVVAERDKVLSGGTDNAIIHLRNLRKVYPGKNCNAKVAVNSLTFSVQEGECFGFLGTNGAGKTTTLAMLTGEESPTSGTAYIFGNDICLHPKVSRRHVGYCPQFDALLDFLTVQEHLELYARIKNVPDHDIKDIVKEKLVEFDLLKHANKTSFSLSGGNKRKLSVAIAMISDPPIVILDEPSTGMDPIAKRFMWDVIAHLSTRKGKTAVILTTHSMNEAQALCTRIGIMVSGNLKCIGSPQHLKTRFGNHLELEVKAIEVRSLELDALCERIWDAIYDFPCHSRGIFSDLEVCIGKCDTLSSEKVSEIRLTWEMIVLVCQNFGKEESIPALITSSIQENDSFCDPQLSEQLVRDGGIPLTIFCEWWLAKEKFLRIDKFIISSFPGAIFNGCNGLGFRYMLPYGKDSSLADIFGHVEHHRKEIGIEEYSISQSTLESIFNHFAASHNNPSM